MGTFNKVDFIRDEIKELPGIDEKPSGGIGAFASRVGYALSLCLKEKEFLSSPCCSGLRLALRTCCGCRCWTGFPNRSGAVRQSLMKASISFCWPGRSSVSVWLHSPLAY